MDQPRGRDALMDISFSQRLDIILALTTALSAQVNTDTTQAQSEARKFEDLAYSTAKSKDEYQQQTNNLILTLKREVLPQESHAEDYVSLDSEGPGLGSYTHVTFHKNGLLSTVFRALPKGVPYPPTAITRVVALKESTPLTKSPPHDPEKEARILVEARGEYIIPLLEAFSQPGGRLILVFPFMPYDLESVLRNKTIDRPQSGMVIQSLFGGLAHLHSHGIIHRDVKPSNILLRTMDGPVYLADFGIAWSANDKASEDPLRKITDVGTTCYRAPEILFGHTGYDASLDIWAAGCVVAELITWGHQQLFDSGPLGSELELIKSIFSTLGTPDTEIWPSAKTFPDWGKMRFHNYEHKKWEEILPGASSCGMTFVKNTVEYEQTRRMTAVEALRHPLVREL